MGKANDKIAIKPALCHGTLVVRGIRVMLSQIPGGSRAPLKDISCPATDSAL